MADLSVPDVFAPDDRVALFCVSMAMAANDVEYAIRQAVLANPDRTSDEERERLRFSQKVRLTYGFLFEGIDALKAWRQQEAAVATFCCASFPRTELLTKVCGLEQQIGTETIAHVRHNTFHYPHPEPSKAERSAVQVKELGEVIASLDDRPATVAMSEEAQHTFPFADQVALRMALLRHDEDAQTLVRNGAIAFVNLIRHIHKRFCEPCPQESSFIRCLLCPDTGVAYVVEPDTFSALGLGSDRVGNSAVGPAPRPAASSPASR